MLDLVMTPWRSPRRARVVLAAAASVCCAWSAAVAYDENVQKDCGDDYLAYCSKHEPNSAETRYCMEAHHEQLSKQCVKALVEAGMVPKKYLSKKYADK